MTTKLKQKQSLQLKGEPEAGSVWPRVLMVEMPAGAVDPAWSVLERKRRLWWHHERRNQYVAQVARALRHGDANELLTFGIRLSAAEKRRARQGWEVVILVESGRHGAAITNVLLGWQLFDAAGDDREGEAGARRKPEGRVVTLTRAWKDGIKAGVLVRATGGRDPLLLDGTIGRGVQVQAAVSLVIDFVDNSDARTTQDTASRILDYEEQELDVINTVKD